MHDRRRDGNSAIPVADAQLRRILSSCATPASEGQQFSVLSRNLVLPLLLIRLAIALLAVIGPGRFSACQIGPHASTPSETGAARHRHDKGTPAKEDLPSLRSGQGLSKIGNWPRLRREGRCQRRTGASVRRRPGPTLSATGQNADRIPEGRRLRSVFNLLWPPHTSIELDRPS
jgi:hypothetical protein